MQYRHFKFLLGLTLIVAMVGKDYAYPNLTSAESSALGVSDTIYLYLPFITKGFDTSSCYAWEGQVPLQTAVNDNICVLLRSGTWTTNEQIEIPSDHRLIGEGIGVTVLKAEAPWIGNGVDSTVEAVVHNNGSQNVTIANFTVDANNLSTFGIGSSGITINSVQIKNAKCDGIAISGVGVVIRQSIVEDNGKGCVNPMELLVPGSGIYAAKSTTDTVPAYYSPTITGNTIRNNGGPGVDIDRVWGGTFSNNTVQDNQAWAAVSIYAAGYWTIENNTIYHPPSADPTHPKHLRCMGGSSGSHSAALSICQDTGDTDQMAIYHSIRNNRIAGWYGIRLIGNDEANLSWVPQFSTIQGNNVYGSYVGCADDHQVGQGSNNGDNVWTNNNCHGTSDTPPDYF